jgi:hypothetical protein
MIFQIKHINQNVENEVMIIINRDDTTDFKIKNSSYFDFAGNRSESLLVA